MCTIYGENCPFHGSDGGEALLPADNIEVSGISRKPRSRSNDQRKTLVGDAVAKPRRCSLLYSCSERDGVVSKKI